MRIRDNLNIYGAIAGAILIVLMHNFLPLAGGTLMSSSLRNALHVPMFVVATGLFWLALASFASIQRAFLTLGASTLFAFVTEAIQKFRQTGTASLADLSIDLIASVLTIVLLYCLATHQPKSGWKHPAGVSAALLLLVSLALQPVIPAVTSYMHRTAVYPEIVDYQGPTPLFFHECRTPCELTTYQDTGGNQQAGLLIKFDRGDWPGVNLLEVLPPELTHQQLQVEFELLGNKPMDLFIITNPSNFVEGAVTVMQPIQSADNSLSIPLADLLPSPSPEYSPQDTLRIGIFASSANHGRQLIVKRVRFVGAEVI